MKFLFIIQGEGRGHFTQALAMKELLCRRGDEVTGILVGKSESRRLPDFFVRKADVPVWTFASPNFLPAPQNKRPGLVRSVFHNICNIPDFVRSMKFIRRQIDLSDADVVINFYELLTGFTYFFTSPRVPLVSVGHQYLFLHPEFRFPEHSSRVQLFFLRFFTRLTAIGAVRKLALSFYPLQPDEESGIVVVPPLVRKEVREADVSQGNYILGYLLNHGYVAEVQEWHDRHPGIDLHFFWDKEDTPDRLEIVPGLTMHRIDDKAFIEYMAGCCAYSTTAGFESVCEALYLCKPIVMVPAHIEQECNAFDAAGAGAGIVADRFDLDGLLQFIPRYKPRPEFRKWVDEAEHSIYMELHRLPSNENEFSLAHGFLRLFRRLSPSFR